MGDFFSRLGEFVWAVLGYWYVWVTTVPFVIDQGLNHKYLPKRLVELADSIWPEQQRHALLKWLCVIGFVVGSFQAFDHVNTELKNTRAQGGYIANHWAALSSDESIALRDKWRSLPPHRLGVLCAIPSCADLAESIYDAAKGLNWPAVYSSTYFQDNGIQRGIEIWSYPERTEDRDKIAVAIEDATKGRLKISLHEWHAAPSLPADILDGINLVIGRLN
jgi:hypothetical protein